MGLKVKLPMIIEMDNKGVVDLANNGNIGGCKRHVDVRIRKTMQKRLPRILMVLHLRNALRRWLDKMFT
jgi:hypothetical protein